MRVRWISGLSLTLVAGALAGCALLLGDGPVAGPRCGFEGDAENPCGECIAAQCQPMVDGCCDDAACKDLLVTLDECASRGAGAACAELMVPPTNGSRWGALSACVASQCSGSCVRGEPVTQCTLGSESCSCSTETPPNDVLCNASAVEDAVCCADLGWPGRDLECRCERLACHETSEGCECRVGGLGPNGTCTGVHCCRPNFTGDTCSCGVAPCDAYETDLGTSCTPDKLGCFGDRAKVQICTTGSGK